MEARGINKRKPLGILIAVVIVGAAVALTVKVASRTKLSTDDASIDAEVIHVASAVGGRIIELPIHENKLVRKGDLLFRIDPVPYQTNVAAAEAQLDVSRAALESKRRLVSAQHSNAEIASEQTHRAETNLELSMRAEERLKPLTAKGYVPKQELDQAEVARQNATSSLTEAKEQETAVHHLVDDVAAAEAVVKAAAAALTNARRALDDTEVHASHEGRIVGLTVSTGELVIPSQVVPRMSCNV